MKDAELVITAPRDLSDHLTREFGCRTTIGVVEQLLLESQREVVLAAPFLSADEGFFGGEHLYTALQNALARGIRARLFLSREGAQAFRSTGIGWGTNVPQVFVPKQGADHPSMVGSHAKVVIADGEHAYIGSANLTEPGLSSNFEMGLLVTGDLARNTHRVWQELVAKGFFISDSG